MSWFGIPKHNSILPAAPEPIPAIKFSASYRWPQLPGTRIQTLLLDELSGEFRNVYLTINSERIVCGGIKIMMDDIIGVLLEPGEGKSGFGIEHMAGVMFLNSGPGASDKALDSVNAILRAHAEHFPESSVVPLEVIEEDPEQGQIWVQPV